VEHVLTILAAVGLFSLLPVLVRARRQVRPTTLHTAWFWAAAVWWLWTVAAAVSASRPLSPGLADHLWYAVSVLALCPPIAVLGGRRPGVRVWSWFVLLPLVLVFAWPSLADWNSQWRFDRLQLATPMLLGYLLVMLMGLGNYFGTRFTIAALLLGIAEVLLILPVSSAAGSWSGEAVHCRTWGSLLLVAAVWAAIIAAKRPRGTAPPLRRLWTDFRDWFGVVWAKRFADRINDTAQRENWPVRLDLRGFVRSDNQSATADEIAGDERIERAFRWLLRRFVDPEWIDQRLK
jgi:hypothetical protein